MQNLYLSLDGCIGHQGVAADAQKLEDLKHVLGSLRSNDTDVRQIHLAIIFYDWKLVRQNRYISGL